MRRLTPLFVAFALLMPTHGFAQAWSGIKTGKISGLDTVVDGNNFGVRVYTDGTPMCGTGTQAWVYMNKGADNYDAVFSSLMSAYLAERTVVLHSIARGEYCELGYVMLRGK